MEPFHKDIVAAYLYIITRYGYPPPAENTERHILEFRELGFKSIELEGIRRDHLEKMHGMRDIADRKGLTYHLHPCYGSLINSTDAFLLFSEKVKRDNLRFNLDTANQYFMKENLFMSIIRLNDRIGYIHISDNGGNKVEHLRLGDGKIRWEVFLEALDRISYRGLFGIDIGGQESAVPDLDDAYRSAAKWLADHWFRLND